MNPEIEELKAKLEAAYHQCDEQADDLLAAEHKEMRPMSLHSFDPEIAEMVGVPAAVLYEHIKYSTSDQDEDMETFDGMIWIAIPMREFRHFHPYLGKTQINNAILRLADVGIIKRKALKKHALDNRMFYALSPLSWERAA